MRVALVGLGYIAELHYQAALKAGADGIIGCDVNPAFAEAFASRPGVEAVVTDLDAEAGEGAVGVVEEGNALVDL